MAKKSVQIQVTGRVQNVGFRYATQQKATALGINGFVQNYADGSVYIEAEAEEIILNEFVLWCYKGPDWATVFNVNVNNQPIQHFVNFQIKR